MDNLGKSNNAAVKIWLFVFCSLIFLTVMKADPDLFGHLKFGQTILDGRSIPKTDLFSYTAYGAQWINHEWLSEVIFWTVYSNFHAVGLIVLRLFLGLLFCFFLWKIVSSDNFYGSAALFLYIFFIVVPFWHFRPHIFTFLFFVIMLYLLKNEKYFLVPPLFIFWQNLHGGFVAGLAYLFIYAVFSDKRKKLLLISAVSLLLTFVNPYGWKLWHGIFRAFFNPYTRALIEDWRPSGFLETEFIGYWVLVFFYCFMTAVNFKKIRINEFAASAAFLFLSFSSVRHIPVFALVCAPQLRKPFVS